MITKQTQLRLAGTEIPGIDDVEEELVNQAALQDLRINLDVGFRVIIAKPEQVQLEKTGGEKEPSQYITYRGPTHYMKALTEIGKVQLMAAGICTPA